MEISEKTGTVQVVVGGHSEGEVWGLDVHPTTSKFITASYDGTVRLWDLASKVRELIKDQFTFSFFYKLTNQICLSILKIEYFPNYIQIDFFFFEVIQRVF